MSYYVMGYDQGTGKAILDDRTGKVTLPKSIFANWNSNFLYASKDSGTHGQCITCLPRLPNHPDLPRFRRRIIEDRSIKTVAVSLTDLCHDIGFEAEFSFLLLPRAIRWPEISPSLELLSDESLKQLADKRYFDPGILERGMWPDPAKLF